MKTTTFYRSLFIAIMCSFVVYSTHAQIAFTNSNSLTPTATHSGCAVTVVDINSDGLDDMVKMDQSTTLVIEMQNKNGTYTNYNLGVVSGGRVWGMAVADVDHNGWKDVATGRNGTMYLVSLSWTGSTIAAATTTLTGSYFVQNITFGDFNNDGWVDLEVCDDNDFAKVYVNTAGTLSATIALINTEINPGLTVGGDPYDSGNYGSVWTDFDNDGDLDLYIAHCRQSASGSSDQRRRDRLFVNDGNNVYSEQAQAFGIEVSDFKQTWTTSFGDLDNDGDLDIVMTNHGENGQILQNDGTGNFTDITASTGFSTPGADPLESSVEDFDNDGFLDILIAGGGGGDSYFLYHNNGNSTFTLAISPFPTTTNGMLSFATGDLNHDGRKDVFASYGGVYNNPTSTDDVLYLNTTRNTNHFITFDLTGTTSNLGAIGARVTIYGPWGIQIREVRAGESYGTSNSMQIHFGLGQSTSVDSARIDWPSHLQTHLTNLAADQFVTVVEGGCVITDNIIPGPFIICTGQTLTLNTGAGFSSYDWSTGDTASSIIVSTTGDYNVTVTDINGCSNVSASVHVQVDPDETPAVSVTGQLEFCDGGNVTLNSSPAASYVWTSGETTQSISVSTPGLYAVTIQGLCAAFTSDSTTVNVLAAPLPVTGDVTVNGAQSVTMQATGDSILWYDQPTGGTLLGTGASFQTPVLSSTTTYWVANATSYADSAAFTGMPNHAGGSLYSGNTTNAEMLFDVIQPCTLATVKVTTDTPGNRTVQLKNSSGTVISSAVIYAAIGTSVVTLNFVLSPGTNYVITTDIVTNNSNFGFDSPRLQRSSQGVNYPYTASDDLTITGSDQGSSWYYYFYDWKVIPAATICVSTRVQVQAIIILGISNFTADNNFQIYPNPASQNVTVSFSLPGATTPKLEIIDAVGRVVYSTLMENTSGNYKQVFDVSNFTKGIYTIHVSSNDKTSYHQLVIQ